MAIENSNIRKGGHPYRVPGTMCHLMSQDDGTRRLSLYRLAPQTRTHFSSEVNLCV